MPESTDAREVRRQSGCFVCGADNPRGLHLSYEITPDGASLAIWRPEVDHEGYSGIVHGGLVSTVLDEAMSKAVAGAGGKAFTAEMRVRYRRHVASDGTFHVRGWVTARNKRLWKTEAQVCAPDGTEHAHAWASFLAEK
jgi:acyl-coenzyme A thioesterase PaaI-like protein